MVTFNVDSLDFSDDEEARFGADADFATRFDSANSRLELEDLTNATVGFVPQDAGTDLVGGKFAETVSEGKALADNGNVYDSIQGAVDNASSWVKVGPGTFNESVTISTAGLTLEGSGERTVIVGRNSDVVSGSADNIIVKSISVLTKRSNGLANDGHSAITLSGNNIKIIDVTVEQSDDIGINTKSAALIYNCTIIESDGRSIYPQGNNSIVVNNNIKETLNEESLVNISSDTIVAYNIINPSTTGQVVENVGDDNIFYANYINGNGSVAAIQINSTDNIVAKNRIIGGIDDQGTATLLDSNLTT